MQFPTLYFAAGTTMHLWAVASSSRRNPNELLPLLVDAILPVLRTKTVCPCPEAAPPNRGEAPGSHRHPRSDREERREHRRERWNSLAPSPGLE